MSKIAFQMNIGLERNDKCGRNDPAILQRHLFSLAVACDLDVQLEEYSSSYEGPEGLVEERGLKVRVAGNFQGFLPVKWIDHLAEQYAQDCIAVWMEDKNRGMLIGPKAAEWGEFNPDFFNFF